jgi:hypothetical protein
MFKFLRWLPVPLLPLLGLFIGIWLMPVHKPRWEFTFPSEVATVGMGFIDQGKTLLLIETKVELPKNFISNNAYGLIGLNAQTGEQLFRTPLSEELLKGEGVQYNNASLAADEEGILLVHRVEVESGWDNYHEIVVYDWKTQQIKKRYRSNCSNGAINFPMLRGTTLVALGAAHTIRNLILWNGVEDTPTVQPLSKVYFDFGLSDDGAIVHVLAGYEKPYQLILIDSRQKKQIHVIEGHFREVRWARDLQSFLAVEYDPKEKVHFTRRYQLVGKQYEPDPSSKGIIAHTGNISRGKSHLTMTTYNQFHPWRMKVTSWLGDSSKVIVDRLWPEGTALQLHDDQTGQLVHRLILPKTVRGSPFVHPDGQTVAMCDTRTISLWEFQSTARWYPLYGFLAGLLVACMLVWRLVRRQRTTSVPSALPASIKG